MKKLYQLKEEAKAGIKNKRQFATFNEELRHVKKRANTDHRNGQVSDGAIKQILGDIAETRKSAKTQWQSTPGGKSPYQKYLEQKAKDIAAQKAAGTYKGEPPKLDKKAKKKAKKAKAKAAKENEKIMKSREQSRKAKEAAQKIKDDARAKKLDNAAGNEAPKVDGATDVKPDVKKEL